MSHSEPFEETVTTVRYVVYDDIDRYVEDGWRIKSLQCHHSAHAVLAVKEGIHDDPPPGA